MARFVDGLIFMLASFLCLVVVPRWFHYIEQHPPATRRRAYEHWAIAMSMNRYRLWCTRVAGVASALIGGGLLASSFLSALR